MRASRYLRFLCVGAFVGVVTVACRELIAGLLQTDTMLSYTVSVGAAYTAGILLSFALNSGLTFRQMRGERRLRALPRFAAIALLGLGTTSALSLALRYGLALDAVLGSLADAAAFVAAALCASVLTYSLTARFVFVRVG